MRIKFLFIKNLLLLIFILITCFSKAQKIKITIPSQANKEYSFVLNKGINQDTIQQGTVSFLGDLIIHIPEKYKDYAGIGSLSIKGIPFIFNIIVNNENFSVEQMADGKYYFKDSPENEYLYSIIQDKKMPVTNNSLYASRFMELVNYKQVLYNTLSIRFPKLNEKINISNYALKELNFETLYTSMLWFSIIDGLIRLYENQQSIGENMIKILNKIQSDEVFIHLSENLITITDQYGWDDTFDTIVTYLENSGKIKYPQGIIYEAFASAKVRKGLKAPPVKGLSVSISEQRSEYNLIVFYQPDCKNCHQQMELLTNKYMEMKNKGVRIISISGGNNKYVFEQEKKLYPWTDKLCDFEGYSGKNFINYGIMGTPVFFLLDKNGIVLKRFAQVPELENYIHSLKNK